MNTYRRAVPFVLALTLSAPMVQTGFAGVLFQHFEANFEKMPEVTLESLRAARLQKTFAAGYDKTWDAVLSVLTQQAFLVHVSKEKGTITFFDVDGLLMGKRYQFMEFPYALLVAPRQQETTVNLLPLVGLYEKRVSGKDRLKLETALTRKGEDFLEQLSVQMTAESRWQRFSDTPSKGPAQ